MNDETKNQEPQTVDPAAGTGAYFTPKAAIDAIMANPPLGEAAAVGARVPRTRDGEDHMSKVDAAKILAVLAAGRTRTEDEVTALEMGARRLCTKWFFQEQRRWARRRARRLAGDGSPHLVPEVPEVPANPGEEVAR